MKYITVLRGINVSGQKKIKMVDLQSLYEKLGFTNIVTYIQSGNVIFDSTSNDKKQIIDSIESAITGQYGFIVPVIIRTHAEIEKIINNLPCGSIDLAADGTKYLLTMLRETPSKENIAKLMSYVKQSEKLIVAEQNIYLYCPNGYGRSKLTNVFIENKLKIQATTRNWKTVVKLFALSESKI